MHHASYWIKSTEFTQYPSLKDNLHTQVVVVGGGIAGLMTAYQLQKSGKQVIVLEADRILHGVTGHTTAKITSQHGLIYQKLMSTFGKEKAQQYAQAQECALDVISKLVKKHDINCDFQRAPAYTYTTDTKQIDNLKAEVEAAKALDLPAEFVSPTDKPFPIKAGVCFHHQAHFHPLKFLQAIARMFTDMGGQIFEHSRVHEILDQTPAAVSTISGQVTADDIILATHFPLTNSGAYFSRLQAKRSYVLGVYLNQHVPQGMYISADRPIYSLRTQPTDNGPMLVVTGFEHPVGQPEDTNTYYQQLEHITRQQFDVKKVAYRWSTQDTYTPDQVPFIGKASPFSNHLYVATGFGGWGITNGLVAGYLIKEIILGRTKPWDIFDPDRTEQLKKTPKLIKQNVHVIKKFIKDRIYDFPKAELDSIAKGQSKVIDYKDEKVAVYHDYQGKIHLISAVCSHMGCVVNFNSAETSWDCPCHGSRFSINGKVLHGPATKKLLPIKISSE